jgi:hypothetical protein
VYALQRTRTKCGVLASYKAREIDGQSVTDYLGSIRIPLAETSERHGSFVNMFKCLLRILSRRRCCRHGHRFRSHRSTAYGRGGGVGRGLGVGANLGVGVGLAVAVGVAVAVAVGVGLAPPPWKLNLPMRVFQPAL